MKILIVITGLGVGGAERVVSSLADEMARMGHEVIIAFLTGPALITPKNKHVRIINLEVNSVPGMIRAYFKLKKLIDLFKPDVVHSHLIHANILCRLLRITAPIPKLISSAHNNNEEGRFRMLAYQLTDKLTDITTNVSNKATQTFIELKAVRPEKIITLHNGIPTHEFFFSEQARANIRNEIGIGENQKLVLAVGRLNEAKDYPNLFDSLAKLKNKNQSWILAIAGDGPLKTELEKILITLNLQESVRFLGVRDDIPQLMSAADVFVLSSAWEGFGLVVAEAMACERVIVATDCGGVKEVLGDTGFLVQPKDSSALSDALEKALTLPTATARSLGKKARSRVEQKYSLSSATRKWVEIYKNPAPQSSPI